MNSELNCEGVKLLDIINNNVDSLLRPATETELNVLKSFYWLDVLDCGFYTTISIIKGRETNKYFIRIDDAYLKSPMLSEPFESKTEAVDMIKDGDIFNRDDVRWFKDPYDVFMIIQELYEHSRRV